MCRSTPTRPPRSTRRVGIRLRAVLPVRAPRLSEVAAGASDPEAALETERPVVVVGEGGARVATVPFYRASALQPGHRLRGPAVIVRDDTTVFLEPGDAAGITPLGDVVVEVSG